MRECQALDLLVTPYVDGEASERDRQIIAQHLGECASCRARVDAEATARHTLRAHAAVARTLGVEPSWRPRAFRLGKPALVVSYPAAVAAGVALLLVGAVFVLRPSTVSAVGVIGDSHCGPAHRYTALNQANNRTCTLRCVARGARFVLVSEGKVVTIANQDFPDLAAFANEQVQLTGRMTDKGMTVTRVIASP